MTTRQRSLLIYSLLALGLLLALAALWRWGPLQDWLNMDVLGTYISGLQNSVWGPVVTVTAFAIGGAVSFPLTVLITVAALVFGAVWGFAYSVAGVIAGAITGYSLGRLLGQDRVQRLGGKRVNQLSRQLGRRGMVSVMLVRFMPIIPFTVVNLVAGATRIKLRDFIIGTAVGLTPLLAALSAFAEQAYWAIKDPEPETLAWLGGLTVAVGLILLGLYRWAMRQEQKAAESGSENDA